jgi:hypothetical protein
VKKIVQITPKPEGWEAVFFSYDGGELFRESVLFWALLSETPYVDNDEEEKTYIEGQVLFENGCNIVGVYDFPQCPGIHDLHGNIGFLGYLNTRLPEKYRRQQMEYFKKEAEGLMKIRKSGHLPDNKI